MIIKRSIQLKYNESINESINESSAIKNVLFQRYLILFVVKVHEQMQVFNKSFTWLRFTDEGEYQNSK